MSLKVSIVVCNIFVLLPTVFFILPYNLAVVDISEKLPKEFVNRIKNQLWSDADQYLEALAEHPPVSVRVNSHRSTAEVAGNTIQNLAKVPWHNSGFYLPVRPVFTIDPLFQAGCYYVQEASSMFLSKIWKQIVGTLNADATILDLCAAPGGKSTLLLEEIPSTMLLVSNEVIRTRVSTLAANITKWGKTNAVVTSNDPRDFKKLTQFFDVIVVDAPCSGEGMFRKDKKAVAEWSEENVVICSARQQRIVADILPSLKPGGYLIYCTCTFAPQENRENLQNFVNAHELRSVEINLDFDSDIVVEQGNDIFSYHFYPHKIKGEGFFIACLQLTNAKVEDQSQRGFKFEFLHKKQHSIVDKWVQNPANLDFVIWKDVITGIPKHFLHRIAVLSTYLFIVKKGIEIGKIMGDDLIPSHELAVSEIVNSSIQVCEFTKEEAFIYLKKGEVSAFSSITALANGWALVQFHANNLGWAKKIGHRTNNYLPKEIRILKDF